MAPYFELGFMEVITVKWDHKGRFPILEDGLTVSYKTKSTPTMKPSNRAPWWLPKRAESL